MDDLFGIRTRLRLVTGEEIEGWYYGRTELGWFIAEDPDGKKIRFIPSDEWGGSSFDHESETARFRPHVFAQTLEAYRTLFDDLWRPMSEAISAIDLNHLRRIGLGINAVRSQIVNFEREPWEPDDRVPIHVVLEARSTYEELLDEIRRSGVRDILLERKGQIRSVTSEYTIPSMDGYYADRYEIQRMIQLAKEQDNLSDTDLGQKHLDRLSAEVLSTTEKAELEERPKSENNEAKATRLRSAAAWLKITTGGGLAVANLTLGGLAGVVFSLPTLGLGTVAAVVGIATSTYTGLNAASDALKDMASNLEKR